MLHCVTPKDVGISITGKCNLTCKYCFYTNEMVGLQDLKTRQWLEFFPKLKDLKVMSITISGGEAFARPDLFELLDGIIANKMRYSILSNGTYINDRIIEKFSIGKRKKRLDYIQISIDGSTADIHNKSRPGSFKKAVNGLRLLKKNNFPVTARVTVNRHNLKDLENIAALLLDDIGLSSISTNDAMPIGSGCRSSEQVSLNEEQKLEALHIYKRLIDRYPLQLRADAGPQAKLKMYAEMEQARNGVTVSTSWKMGHLSSCGCTSSRLDILHDGTIVPCCLLPEIKLGNILKDSLEEIWNHHPFLTEMRNRRDIATATVQGCETCEWNTWCNGGCPAVPYSLYKDLHRTNPEDCLKKFLATNHLSSFAAAMDSRVAGI